MARHRIITRERNKITIIATASALSVAVAASAAAAAWPSVSLAGPAAFSNLTIAGGTAPADQPGTQHHLGATRAPAAGHAAALTGHAAAKRAQSRQARWARKPAHAAAPPSSGSPRSIAKTMLASFGWSSSQFSCLEPLWAGESGWRVTASNPTTGAYGIPQALPAPRMASAGPDWHTDATTQIKWGLKYIQGTYGSPCAAWRHERAVGWY